MSELLTSSLPSLPTFVSVVLAFPLNVPLSICFDAVAPIRCIVYNYSDKASKGSGYQESAGSQATLTETPSKARSVETSRTHNARKRDSGIAYSSSAEFGDRRRDSIEDIVAQAVLRVRNESLPVDFTKTGGNDMERYGSAIKCIMSFKSTTCDLLFVLHHRFIIRYS